MNYNKFLGFNFVECYDETNYYSVGSDGNIPIALVLLSISKYKNIIDRYFSFYLEDKDAKKSAEDFKRQNLNFEKLENQFNESKFEFDGVMPKLKPWTPPKFNMDLINIPDYELTFDLITYSLKFAKFFSMLNYHFENNDSHHSVPQVPSITHMNFENRTEFKDVYLSIEKSLVHLMNEFIKIAKDKGIKINEEKFTIDFLEYRAIKFAKDTEFKYF
jgi:hypothetical protein